jgi:hypothetical protein
VLKIARRQFEQVLKYLGAQHRVDPVTGVEYQILSRPRQQG